MILIFGRQSQREMRNWSASRDEYACGLRAGETVTNKLVILYNILQTLEKRIFLR